jgi:hypothetical protein
MVFTCYGDDFVLFKDKIGGIVDFRDDNVWMVIF